MSPFIFESYGFDEQTGVASFSYSYGDDYRFTERLTFTERQDDYDKEVFERALFLAFLLVGTSYYKTFPARAVEFRAGDIDKWQATFLNSVYQEGLSQFAFENSLTRDDLAHFDATTDIAKEQLAYDGEGTIALQSGGKDSLLTAALLEQQGVPFTPLYVTSGETHPAVLDQLSVELLTVKREIDLPALRAAQRDGGRNGHVPVTFIVLSIALLQAILSSKQTVLASIGHEGEEPHAMVGDLAITHQWSKTWPAEQLFAEYVTRYVSPSLRVGSPLRSLSELRISQLFAERAWSRFGHSFSSCNRANYGQGVDNTQLTWCGTCPKCANAYVLFAPYVERDELTSLFGGKDLFAEPVLTEAFKGLLGIDGVMKPFECVGEIDELRYAYHLSEDKGYARLPFAVPASSFDVTKSYDAQAWAEGLVSVEPGTI